MDPRNIKSTTKPPTRRKVVVTSKEPEPNTRLVNYLSRNRQLELGKLAAALMEPGKGVLAVDESMTTIDNCLRGMNLAATDRNRVRYLDLVLADTRVLAHFISGVLVRQEVAALTPQRGQGLAKRLKEAGMLLGARVDTKFVRIKDTPAEWTTEGVDELQDLCPRLLDAGVSFVLWRCVYIVSWCTPSRLAVEINSRTVARAASLCQTSGLVPILSLELLSYGDFGPGEAKEALKEVLSSLTHHLLLCSVCLEGVIIRITPTFPGNEYPDQYTIKEVVQNTLQVCNGAIPPAVGGVMLARQETLADSVHILNLLNQWPMKKPLPISFCFSRVIHYDVIRTWAGSDVLLHKAKNAILDRVRMVSLASLGQYPESNRSVFIENISSSPMPAQQLPAREVLDSSDT